MDVQHKTNKERNRDAQINLPELQQEALMLCITGLMYKQAADAMGKTESDVKQYMMRVAEYFKLDAHIKSTNAAISIATDIGFKDYLFARYKDKHCVHIERFEKGKEEIKKKLMRGLGEGD